MRPSTQKVLWWLLGWLCLLVPSLSFAETSLNSIEDVGLFPLFFVDPSCQLQLEDVRKLPFTRHKMSTPSFGWINDCVWFSLPFDFEAKSRRYFEIANPLLDSIDVFIEKNAQLIQHHTLGDQQSSTGIPKAIHPAFVWDIEPGRYQMWIRVQSSSSIQVPIKLYEESIFNGLKTEELGIFLFYAGMVTIMIVYNLFVYIGTGNLPYLFYAGFISIFLCVQIALNGFGQTYLWPEAFSNFIIAHGSLVCLLLALLFSERFLNIKQHFAKLKRGFRAAEWLTTLALAATFFVEYRYTVKIMAAFVILSIGGFLATSCYLSFIHRQREAKFYLLAWTSFFLGGLIYLGKQIGILPYSNFTEHAFQIGNIIEISLLSFALADRYNTIQKKARDEERLRAETEEKLRLELQTRVMIVSDLAHRINNPLNYVQSGLTILKLEKQDLHSKISQLLASADADPELEGVKADFQNHFKEMDKVFVDMQLGISRSAYSIKEIRSLSGVDGYHLEHLRIEEINEIALERLNQDNLQRPHLPFLVSEAEQGLAVPTNRIAIGVILELLLRELYKDPRIPGRISLVTRKDQEGNLLIWLIKVPQDLLKQNESLKELLDRCNHILHPFRSAIHGDLETGTIEISFPYFTAMALEEGEAA